MSLQRARARRNMRMAQISALGLVGLAGLLVAMPPSGHPVPAPPITPAVGGPATGRPAGEAAPVDYALALAALDNRVERRAEQPKTEPIEEPIDVPPTPPPTPPTEVEGGAPHFVYVGSIVTPRRSFAFIQQPDPEAEGGMVTKLVAQGELIGDYLVLGVSSERLILENTNNVEERFEYNVTARPETMPTDSTLGMAATTPAAPPSGKVPPNMPANMHNSPSNAGRNAEMAYDEALKDPAMRERYKEIEEKRAAAMNKNGVQPPPQRPAPTTGQPQPRPATPATKPAPGAKDQK